MVAHSSLHLLRYPLCAHGPLQLIQIHLLQLRSLLQRLYQICHICLVVPAQSDQHRQLSTDVSPANTPAYVLQRLQNPVSVEAQRCIVAIQAQDVTQEVNSGPLCH
jgi:hypothetical protein